MSAPTIGHPWQAEGGPAFPSETSACHFRGMTLRDWFAGEALPAVIGAASSDALYMTQNSAVRHNAMIISELAYAIADAMLKERERGAEK